jgi:hypothetical protein
MFEKILVNYASKKEIVNCLFWALINLSICLFTLPKDNIWPVVPSKHRRIIKVRIPDIF